VEEPVFASDVTVRLNAILLKAGQDVVLLPEDITFVGEKNTDGVKNLGTFEIQIKLFDSAEIIRKEITVKAQK